MLSPGSLSFQPELGTPTSAFLAPQLAPGLLIYKISVPVCSAFPVLLGRFRGTWESGAEGSFYKWETDLPKVPDIVSAGWVASHPPDPHPWATVLLLWEGRPQGRHWPQPGGTLHLEYPGLEIPRKQWQALT